MQTANKVKTALALLTLILLSSALPELTTSSTLLADFLRPSTFLLLALLGYGIPVLILRELAIRFHLNYLGIFYFGIAFGLYSEGFIAKTLILSTALPSAAYNNYGYYFGLSIPFALAISIWHALASVVLPIFFTHSLFPEKKSDPWLPKWLSTLLGLALAGVGIGIANFLNPNIKIAGTLPALTLLLSSIFILIFLGFHYGKRTLVTQNEAKALPLLKPLQPLQPFYLGFLTIFYFAFNLVAWLHLPILIFFGLLIASVYYYYKKYSPQVTTERDYLLFGLGFYVQQTLLAIVLRLIFGGFSTIVSIIPLFIFMAITIFYVRKRPEEISTKHP